MYKAQIESNSKDNCTFLGLKPCFQRILPTNLLFLMFGDWYVFSMLKYI